MRSTILVLAFVVLAIPNAPVRGELRLPKVFGHQMVLQRDKPIRIWGWADAGAQVTVSFAGAEVRGAADDDGAWQVELPPQKSSFENHKLTVQANNETIAFDDVLIGEVWVCGGQSNMEWTLRGSRDADIEIPSADYPAIRFLRLPKIARPEVQQDLALAEGEAGPEWKRCVSEEAQGCTAVGYYFARRLRRHLRCPVGLIDTSWGGTMAQHWVSMPTLRGFDPMQTYIEEFKAKRKAWDDGGGEQGAAKRYVEDVKAWEKKRAEAEAAGERAPRKPNRQAYEDPATKRQPGGMFNGMIAPIARYTIRGVLFYQGENNSFGVSWKPFPQTFPAVFRDWRAAFKDPQLPIGIIQIAGWSNRRSMTYDMNHHTNIVREVQHLTWERTPNSGLIVTFDANSNGSIHPGRKLPVGERSARWALAEVYDAKSFGSNQPLAWRGPVYESMKVDNGKIVVTFQEGTDNGLRMDQDAAQGFYVAGEDRVFHVATARVAADRNRRPQVVVWSDEVPEPVAVRYAWSNLPLGSLLNGRELPAYPFRSDDWPLTPHQSTGEYQVERTAK